ncbi:MAG: type II toxin-antitoxin system prevent-host-death family antitoxin [Rhodobacteraceae bacterium]|nr:type II toxin-antitoxin system prevent-host-death family antitoxin [Paracoccaceae bacterium]
MPFADAKARFADLLGRAERGERIVVTQQGKSVARLIGAPQVQNFSRFGALKGRIRIAEDFNQHGAITSRLFGSAAIASGLYACGRGYDRRGCIHRHISKRRPSCEKWKDRLGVAGVARDQEPANAPTGDLAPADLRGGADAAL